MFFDSWSGLGRVLIVGIVAYGGLIVILRISGKRTLSKFNAFDLVVTVALGSILATTLLSNDVALAEGILALLLLVSLQYAIAWMSVQSKGFRKLVKSEPALLLHNGEFLEAALRRERISREEVLAALRENDVTTPERAAAVVLETDGSMSVIKAGNGGEAYPEVAAYPVA